MGLFENIDKLINERGSANILRDRLLLAADKYSVLERKISELESAITKRDTQIIKLESENQRLQFDIVNLRQEIQRRDDIIQKEKSHDKLLDEVKVNILVSLSKQNEDYLTCEQVADMLHLNFQIVQYNLDELRKKDMVGCASYTDEPSDWYIKPEGRKYLIENKLIS